MFRSLGRVRTRILWLFVPVSCAALLVAAAAETAVPGANGKIAFISDRDGNFEVYVMSADGSGQTRLTNNAATDASPSWSPDGTKIAFTSDRDGNFEVYVMNADGSGQTRLTNNAPNTNTAAGDTDPTWSPDGTRIAFTSWRDQIDFNTNSEVYVMNADGSDQTNLTNNASGGDVNPSWSPDGTKIAFNSTRDDNVNDVYVMNANGNGQTRLTDNAASDEGPSWSPDGTKIAFTSNRDFNTEVYVMNADGSGQTRLTNNAATVLDFLPSWSPDGTKIAFTSDRDHNLEVYVMNADGSGQTRLTVNPATDLDTDWAVARDASAPTVTCSASPASLKSNKHKLAAITTSVTVSDGQGGSGAAGFTLVSVQSNQADSGLGPDDVPNDIQGWTTGTADTSGQLRTERYGNDRVYTITYRGSDNAGNTATCQTTVRVNKGS